MQPSEAHGRLGDALFLDVREPYEFEAGHLDGSLHIPIGQITARWEEVRDARDVVVVCQIGQRSGLVANFLRERGVDAHNLEGGLEAWVAAGYELTAPGDAQVAEGWARDLSGKRIRTE